jgi:hypothetical protein
MDHRIMTTNEMRAAVDTWLTIIHDRDGNGAQGEPATGLGDRPRETPVSPADREDPLPSSGLPVRAPLPEVRESETMPLLALHRALEHMVTDIDRLADDGDLGGLTAGYQALDAFLKAARDVRNHAEDHIATLMPQDKVNLDDQFTLERHRNRNYRYESVELLRHLVGDQLVDPETGENVYDRLTACLPLTGSLAWRAGALRAHGVDPDQFRETTSSRTTVRVRARAPEGTPDE